MPLFRLDEELTAVCSFVQRGSFWRDLLSENGLYSSFSNYPMSDIPHS